jgi:hypothetical protein
MILTLCAQVQALTSSSQPTTAVTLAVTRDPLKTQDKRQNTNSTPRKQKRSHDQTADLVTEEGSQQSAPLNEDRRTAWDDYTNHSNHD